MQFDNMIDMHLHSNNSPDGRDTVKSICECAIKQNLKIIAITDHCEAQDYYKDNFNEKIAQSCSDIEDAQKELKGKLMILKGCELGQPTQNLEYADLLLNLSDFDYILASLHNLKNHEDFYYMNFENENIDIILTEYFEELLQIAQWNKFDVLAHLTYPLRYIVGRSKKTVQLSKYYKIIDKILLTIIKNEKGLEINVSGFRGPLNDSMPGFSVLKRYNDLGGKIVTIGTDSHKTEYMGRHLKRGMKMLVDAGFNEIFYYVKRQPKSIKIN